MKHSHGWYLVLPGIIAMIIAAFVPWGWLQLLLLSSGAILVTIGLMVVAWGKGSGYYGYGYREDEQSEEKTGDKKRKSR